jgi:hypothetical protein
MIFDRYKRVIVLPVLMLVAALNAQAVLEIKDKRVIKQDETLTISEGTVVKMGPGAFIDVRGTLKVIGSSSKPVVFVNMDDKNPGAGIQVSGILDGAEIQITGVVFNGLIQPIRFDPFWYRKTVLISDVRIQNGQSFEPLIYMATPFIDLRAGRKISVTLSRINVVNNASGLLIESFGSNGIEHDFDKIYFGDNHVSGGDASLGMLHLDFAETINSESLKIGNVAFERNDAGGNPVGLSVNGSSRQSVRVKGLFGEDVNQLVFDQKKDARVPSVNVDKSGSLADYGSISYFSSIKHAYGDLKVTAAGDLAIVELLSEEGQKVELVKSMLGDTQRYTYIQGTPKRARLTDGRLMNLPEILQSNLPNLEVTKIDTAEYNKYKRQIEKSGSGLEQSDILTVGVNIPTFAKKGEVVKKIRVWEIGLWGGGGLYGAGDIKPKFFGLPSTIDVSSGLYGQYNFNSRFSLKLTGYRTTISIHDLYAIGLFSGTKPLRSYNDQYQEFTTSPNSYRVHFSTNMWIGEVEALWHLRSYHIRDGKRSKLIPTLGVSLGMLHYTPYRYAYTNQKRLETRPDYLKRMKEEHKYNLRDLGSEGQYFLPNAKPYSSIAFNIGSSFSLTYLFKRFAFKGEMKVAYTSTDYLDDFGPGFWYGGDVEALRANQQIQSFTSTADLNKIIGYDERIAPNAPRSVDGLNDWYYQMHLGMSYILIK